MAKKKKKTDKPKLPQIMVDVESSNIKKVGYSENDKTLVISFKNDRLYKYTEVPPNIYQELLKSESKGKYFNENINEKFSYEQIR